MKLMAFQTEVHFFPCALHFLEKLGCVLMGGFETVYSAFIRFQGQGNHNILSHLVMHRFFVE
jgi:hypothetical protein